MKRSLYSIGDIVYWMGELHRVYSICENFVFVRKLGYEHMVGSWGYRWDGSSHSIAAWVKTNQIFLHGV